MLTVVANFGHLLILKLYDHRYHEAAWMIPILALGLWHTLLYQTTAPVLFSLGKPKYNAFGNAAYCIGITAGIPIAFHFFGMVGAVIAVAGATCHFMQSSSMERRAKVCGPYSRIYS